ncbi:MAG: DUF2165 family protein, partial [Burkholderiales bacterium]|nr:DUF2165 family protein [Burkholderiales bacterium]
AIIFIISSYAILKSLCQNELNKKFLFMGLLLGLMKYLLFFTAGATEWFYVWQTKNSFKSDSMLISAILLLSLIIVIITE